MYSDNNTAFTSCFMHIFMAFVFSALSRAGCKHFPQMDRYFPIVLQHAQSATPFSSPPEGRQPSCNILALQPLRGCSTNRQRLIIKAPLHPSNTKHPQKPSDRPIAPAAFAMRLPPTDGLRLNLPLRSVKIQFQHANSLLPLGIRSRAAFPTSRKKSRQKRSKLQAGPPPHPRWQIWSG